jgi:RNA polymerase sigma factor (sigma-70 family)
MPDPSRDPVMGNHERTKVIQGLLDRIRAGDDSAREALLASARDRLVRLARHMLKEFRGVARWEGSEDVLQNAMIRLDRSLRSVKPQTAQHFFRLAAAQIRRELIDLARHYFGPTGLGTNHDTRAEGVAEPTAPDSTQDPGRLTDWTEFHARIGDLPEADRELFDLLWYQDPTQAEAVEVLGVSERTVNKRWIAARLRLSDALGGRLPS